MSGEVTFSAEEEEEEEEEKEVEVSIQQDSVSDGVETFTALLSLLPGARLETRAKPQPPLQLFMCIFDAMQRGIPFKGILFVNNPLSHYG